MNSFIILICLCVGCVSYSSASSSLDTPEDAGNTFQQWFKTTTHNAVGTWSKVERGVLDACSCIRYDCGCCAHLEEKQIELNSTICANITYLVHDYGMSFTVTVDDHTIFNETVSVRNPPPVCLGVPYVKEFVDACIRMYDIDATTYHLHACLRLEARMKAVLIAKYELGCFTIGPPGLSSAPQTSSTSNMTVLAVAVTTGSIFVVVVMSVVIALARKRRLAQNRGMEDFCTDLLVKRPQKYGSLVSA